MAVALKKRINNKIIAYQELSNINIPIIQLARLIIVSYLKINNIKKVVLPVNIDKIIRKLNYALLSPYTKIIYNKYSKNNIVIIAQLRTDNIRLNLFLVRIKIINSVTCAYKTPLK